MGVEDRVRGMLHGLVNLVAILGGADVLMLAIGCRGKRVPIFSSWINVFQSYKVAVENRFRGHRMGW
jgi:hypothetical protein